ncbi:hypothetical protein RSAG8_01894, partial [Rhizoctonia solani AG-8 WAC10335]
SHPSPPAVQIFRACIGKARQGEASMSFRERLDMAIVTLLFGAFVGAFSAFSILINQIFAPYGYSSDEAGIMGGVLILAGIVGAAILSPIFDRYLTHHLALAAKILVPLLAASYVALIWDVALEISCEVTRSAETSSAVLWFAGNLLSVVIVLSMDALKDDSPDANPPSNMFKSLIFQGCFVAVIAISVFGLKGQQTRRELDIQKQQERILTASIPLLHGANICVTWGPSVQMGAYHSISRSVIGFELLVRDMQIHLLWPLEDFATSESGYSTHTFNLPSDLALQL